MPNAETHYSSACLYREGSWETSTQIDRKKQIEGDHLKHKPLHFIYKHFHCSVLAYIILHLKCPFKLHFQLLAELCVETFVCLTWFFPLFQKLFFPCINTKNSLSVNCSLKESTLGLY